MLSTEGTVVELSAMSRRQDTALRFNRTAVSYVVAASDAVVIILSALAAGLTYHAISFGYLDNPLKHLAIGLVSAAGFVLLMLANGSYRGSEILVFRRQLVRIVACGGVLTTFFSLIMFLLGVGEDFSRGTFVSSAVTALVAVVTSRLFWDRKIPLATSRGLVEKRQALVICDRGFVLDELTADLSGVGTAVGHVLNVDPDQTLQTQLATMDRGVIGRISEVYVVTRGINAASLEPMLDELRTLPISVKLVLDPFTAGVLIHPIFNLGSGASVEVQRAPLTLAERGLKRSFDIVVSLIAIMCFLPIMVIIAIAIKLDSAGPVIFRQRRRGFNNKPFDIFKFRSMTVMENGDTVRQATRDDKRVTRVGSYIRSASIDELPQFFNVLFGHMSIVGPRPHAMVHDDQYDQLIAKYVFRRHVKPGVTGWAQINGHRGETPTVSSMEQRLHHDLWYIHNWSFWLDIKIVARTFPAMFEKDAAY